MVTTTRRARGKIQSALEAALAALACAGCGAAPDSGGESIATSEQAMILNPALPTGFQNEHHSWHMTVTPTTVSNYGYQFLIFHRHYTNEVLTWAYGQGMNLGPMYEWESVPAALKTSASPAWTTSLAAAETRLMNLTPAFNTEEELGRFLDPGSGLHGFLHGKGSIVFNEPNLGDLHNAPTSSYFYQIHGLIERFHQHWLNWKRSNVVETSNALYARKSTTGEFFKMASPGVWTKISDAARMFVTVGTTLYRLSTDGTTIAKYNGSGTSWTTMGGPAIDIFRCGASLCGSITVNPFVPEASIFRYNVSANNWAVRSQPMRNTSSTASKWYGVHPTGTFTYQFNESTAQWDPIGMFSGDLFVTDTNVFNTSANDGSVWRRTGPGILDWENIGLNLRTTFVAIGPAFYALNFDKSAVLQWAPTPTNRANWTTIGPASDWIYGSTRLYRIDASSTIFRYDSGTWTSLGHP